MKDTLSPKLNSIHVRYYLLNLFPILRDNVRFSNVHIHRQVLIHRQVRAHTPMSDHFTFLCLALCRSHISNCSCCELTHAMAFHTCKTMFNVPPPVVQLLDSFSPLFHNVWGLGEGHRQRACYGTNLPSNVCPRVQQVHNRSSQELRFDLRSATRDPGKNHGWGGGRGVIDTKR